ncbi:MAG: ankyrin repeat domain-containing protein [Alphaproteobacteria bacterium]|nr:ankyrin repeat domain-containing protein [Alphaproteobacteria bacterium]
MIRRTLFAALAFAAATSMVLADDLCMKIETAALEGKNAEIDTLVAQGASVNCQFSDGWTALMHAVYGKKLETVTHLLKAGANPNLARKDGVTALKMAKAGQVLGMGESEVKLYADIEAALVASGAK